MNFVPKQVFFTKGVGTHKKELQSFEMALRDAGIERQNLVYVSSILPPNCKIVSKEKGIKLLKPGQVTFCVMSRISSDEHGRLLSASIGCAVPNSKDAYGYLSEGHAWGMTEKSMGDHTEDLAVSMLASTLGIQVDNSLGWDERKEIYRIENKIVKTTNITQSALAKGNGNHTTVLASAVFIME